MEQGPLEEAYLRFLSGETDAFDSIMTELHIPLIRFIQRYVKNVSVAEDLAEDVFVEILMHRDRFNFKVKLLSLIHISIKQLATRPRASSSFTAPAGVKPMILGISAICGPLLTTSRMRCV